MIRTIGFLLALPLAGAVAFGATIVVLPNANATAAGNASTSLTTLPAASVEIQETAGTGQFPAGTIQITQLSLRAAPGSGPISATIGTLQVYLSTSPNYPNTSGAGKNLMSTTFANNVGADKTLVYSGSNVTLSDGGCTSPGPCPFDINIIFSTPFTYTPASGPLLIDLLETNVNAKSGAFDAASFTSPGGSVAQVVGPFGNATGQFSYQGLILQVTYGPVTAGPTFSGVVNPAGGIPPGFPGYGLAQGSIFTIYGNNLGPSTAAQAATLPLPTTGLGGTTVSISSHGSNPIPVPLLYASNGQINGIIPSNAPLGTDTLTVSYNGASSAIQAPVVASNFGIVQYGYNQAVVTFPSYAVVTPTNTATAGDTLVLWGTGLGALPAGQSDAAGAAGGTIQAPIQVFVGGALASIAYQGRTPGAAGLDQINFVVPSGVPTGCKVSVVVQTGTGSSATVSNAPTIALGSSDGGSCTDPTQDVPQTAIPGLISRTAPAKVLAVQLSQQTTYNGGANPTTTASEQVIFSTYSPALLSNAIAGASSGAAPSLNTCYTQVQSTASTGSGGTMPDGYLDAGKTVTLTPAQGAPTILSATSKGVYNANVSSIPGGAYQFTNVGGADVGTLSFSFPNPQVTWTNRNQIATTPTARASGLPVTWSGGDSTGYVIIFGSASGPNTGNYQIQFACSVPASAGSFTVPASVLLALPATAPGASAGIGMVSQPFPGSLGTIPGFDLTLNLSSYQVSGTGFTLQ
jgi:uncharacterized protein (TIGR03437 family)